MPSANKTPKLGLNNWVGTDKPKREDFVQDNLQLDELVGGHIEDTEAHLTAENREQFSTPVKVGVYAGDGKESQTITLPFSASAVLVYQKGVEKLTDSNGVPMICSGAASTDGSTTGLAFNRTSFTVLQSDPGNGKSRINLNEAYGQYLYIAMR